MRRELTALFHSKCAYCESEFAHVAPGDIEHFRPKKRIDTGNGVFVPGYYWLATEWSNLFLSCQFCNRKSYHASPDLPPGEVATMGKMDQFPLSDDPTHRVRSHEGDLSSEEPFRLLLDPCIDDPEQHLLFTWEGLVEPRNLAGGNPSLKGHYSIAVFALQRKDLVEKREEYARKLIKDLENLIDSAFNYANASVHNDEEALTRNQVALERNIEALKSYLSPTSPYLALVRQIIKDYDRDSKFTELKDLGIDPMEQLELSVNPGN